MQGLGWNGAYLPFITGAVGAGTAWAFGESPLNGFSQGYGIGALNQIIGDDGKVYTASFDDVVVVGKYNWMKHPRVQNLKDFAGMSSLLTAASLGFELNQRALVPGLSSASRNSRYLSLYSNLGNATNLFGKYANAAGLVGLGLDYQAMNLGEISKTRFVYHTTGFGVSVGVGSMYGGLPGATAGGMFWAGEMLYDNIIVPAKEIYWQIEMRLRNLQYYISSFY